MKLGTGQTFCSSPKFHRTDEEKTGRKLKKYVKTGITDKSEKRITEAKIEEKEEN